MQRGKKVRERKIPTFISYPFLPSSIFEWQTNSHVLDHESFLMPTLLNLKTLIQCLLNDVAIVANRFYIRVAKSVSWCFYNFFAKYVCGRKRKKRKKGKWETRERKKRNVLKEEKKKNSLAAQRSRREIYFLHVREIISKD